MNKSPKKRIGLLIGALLAIWIVACAVLGGSAYANARSGQRTLTTVSHADLVALQNGGQDAALAKATDQLDTAHSRLSNPILLPLRAVPLLNTQLASGRALSSAGATTSTIALDTLQKLRPLGENAKIDRAGSLAELATVLKANDAKLQTVDLGPKEHLVKPIAAARQKGVNQLNTFQRAMSQGGAASQGLSKLLSEENDYLLIAANNGEMRNGSGMFLQAGLLRTGGGRFQVDDMNSVAEINGADRSIAWPADIQANWGFLGHQGAMQNLMLSPRYDVNAPLAQQIWTNAGKPDVDGVITIDIAMMKALIGVTGPITVGDLTLTTANVEQTLLFDQYKGLGARTSSYTNDDRRDVLSDIAGAAFEEFASGDWTFSTAAKELSSAARGRHVMLFSNDPAQNINWVNAGVSGVVPPNATTAALVNLSTNKLDQFMTMDTTIAARRTATSVETTMTIDIANRAPENGPAYVLGPVQNSALTEGEYAGMLALSLPAQSTSIKFDSDLPLTINGVDGNSVAIATAIDVPRGNSQRFVLHFSQPPDATESSILPTGRVKGVTWSYEERIWKDDSIQKIIYPPET